MFLPAVAWKGQRLLTLVDNFTRESLAIEVDERLGGQRVVEVLMRVAEDRNLPETIRMDNGPEFTSKRLDQWAYLNGVKLDFSRPGKPTDNAFIESFNGRFRQECLNENWFCLWMMLVRRSKPGGKSIIMRGLMEPWATLLPRNIPWQWRL